MKLGRYKHYKGNIYVVLGTAKDIETLAEIVIYRALYGDSGTWVRPRGMFEEDVMCDGRLVPRFLFLDNSPA